MTRADNIYIQITHLWQAGKLSLPEFQRLVEPDLPPHAAAARRAEIHELLDRHRRVADLEDLPLL